MLVRKFNKTVHLKIEDEENLEDIAYSDGLFWNDLRIDDSEWLYLVDDNRNEVCFLTDYGFNVIDELLTGRTAILHYRPNDPEYEFNQE